MKVNLVTPYGTIFKGESVEKFTIPTEHGVITILEDHVPMISIVTTGEVVINLEDKTEETIAISRGILEIRQNSEIYVLADTAEKAQDIDIEKAEEARKAAAKEFLKKQHNLEDVEFARIQAKIEKELARINVGSKWRNINR